MDAFTAVVGHLPGNDVIAMIQQQQQAFQQYAGEALLSKLEMQSAIVEKYAPSLGYNEIKRLEMQRSQVLNPFGVEELTTEFGFKTTTEFNQLLLLADDTIAKMHKLRQIEAWGIKYDSTRNTLINERLNSGLIQPAVDGYSHREYSDDAEEYKKFNQLTGIERNVVQANQQRAIKMTLDEIDFSSIYSGGL